ncbi:Hemerythrin-like domain-containing protein [Plasmodiophora brassicae]
MAKVDRSHRDVDPASAGRQDGVAFIVKDHDYFRALFSEYRGLLSRPTLSPSRDVLVRKLGIVRDIVRDVSGHASAEERYLYPLIMTHLQDRSTDEKQCLYDRNVTDDTLNKHLLQFLENHLDTFGNVERCADACQMLALLDRTVEKFIWIEEEHLKEEEEFVLDPLSRVMSADERHDLWRDLIWALRHGPTHPHPEGPSSPIPSLVIHPLVGVLDKLLDRMKASARESA